MIWVDCQGIWNVIISSNLILTKSPVMTRKIFSEALSLLYLAINILIFKINLKVYFVTIFVDQRKLFLILALRVF